MPVDTAFERLRDANPVKDPASLRNQSQDLGHLLAFTRQRSADMQAHEKRAEATSRPSRPRGLLIGIGVAVAVLLAVLMTIGIVQEFNSETATPPAEQVTDQSETESLAVVADAYTAYNAGDANSWLNTIWPEFTPNELGVDRGEGYAASTAAASQINVVGCVSKGPGDWRVPAEADVVSTGYLITCEATETNDFHGAGGIELKFAWDWVVADGVVIAQDGAADFEDADAFNLAFRNWLATTHKDVSLQYEFLPWLFPVASSVPTALEYVDEFVDSSPDWPRP